jgi:general stress protein 26
MGKTQRNRLDHERRKLRRLIEDAGVAMFMTLDDRGEHAGRPMLPLLLDNDPHIYFLTHQNSRKMAHIAAHPQVGLAMNSAARCYLSIVGRASVTHDRALLDRLWRPSYRAWFPDGEGDREAAVVRVAVERIDYWEPPRSGLTRLFQALKALVTHRAVETPMKTLDGL